MASGLRHTLRGLMRRPLAGAATALTLALAIGANVAVGSVVYGLLLAPLPFPDAEKLVTIEAEIGGEPGKMTAREVRALEQDSRVFSDVAAFYPSQYNLTGEGLPESVVTIIGTGSLFRMLGVRPVVGEIWPASLDWTTQSTVLLTHGLWQRRYGSDRSIIGRSITLDAGPYLVAGVLPAGFDYPAGVQLYRAVTAFTAPTVRRFTVVARLEAGLTLAAGEAELTRLAADWAAQFPDTNRHTRFIVRPLRDSFVGRARPSLWVLTSAVLVALLLAVANVTNLRLARAVEMRSELALRAALGASRGQVVTAAALEGAVLALAGGTGGLLLGAALLKLISFAPLQLPGWLDVQLSWPVTLATVLLVALVTVLVSIVPGWLSSRVDSRAALLDGSQRSSGSRVVTRWQRWLVAVQVAVAVVLLSTAALLVRSLRALDAVDPGFAVEGLLTFRVDPPSRPYSTLEPIALFYRQATERLLALPGVTNVGQNDTLPFGGRPDTTRTMSVEGRNAAPGASDQAFVNTQIVSPSYFAAMRIGTVRGRVFSADDRPDTARVAVISERTARRFWPTGDPIGQRVVTTERKLGTGTAADVAATYQVVGVVQDVRSRSLDAEPALDLYVSTEQVFSGDTFFVIRTAGDPRALRTSVGDAIRQVDANQSLFDSRLMVERVADAAWQTRTSATVLTALAALGLTLALVGTYGVLAYAVARRQRELGIRTALGADAAGLSRLVMREGLTPVAVGLAVGVAATVGVSRLLTAVVFEISPVDPLAMIVAVAALALSAAAACMVPARRAARVDPATALRAD